MKLISSPLAGLQLLELRKFPDERGFFLERFHQEKFRELGIEEIFVQDNHSRSYPKVLRGLHFQTNPAQGKLVSCLRGRIYDVAVDLRKGSPTFGKYFGTELSDENNRVLWVPFGFAHGFCVIGDEPADVLYKVNGVYNAKTEGGIRWNDPEVGVEWPIQDPIVSPKDALLPTLRETAAL